MPTDYHLSKRIFLPEALLQETNVKASPFLSSKNPHFENKGKCKTFLVIMSLICMRVKDDFYINGFA